MELQVTIVDLWNWGKWNGEGFGRRCYEDGVEFEAGNGHSVFLTLFVEIEVSSVFKKNSGVIRSFFY